MAYSKNEIQNFRQKDRRIAWLSIFSSLTRSSFEESSMNTLKQLADDTVEHLFRKYPDIEEEPTYEPVKDV